jgi:hypothetical protein
MDKVFYPIAGQVYVLGAFRKPPYLYIHEIVYFERCKHMSSEAKHIAPPLLTREKTENASEVLEPKKAILIFDGIFNCVNI